MQATKEYDMTNINAVIIAWLQNDLNTIEDHFHSSINFK